MKHTHSHKQENAEFKEQMFKDLLQSENAASETAGKILDELDHLVDAIGDLTIIGCTLRRENVHFTDASAVRFGVEDRLLLEECGNKIQRHAEELRRMYSELYGMIETIGVTRNGSKVSPKDIRNIGQIYRASLEAERLNAKHKDGRGRISPGDSSAA